MTKTNNMKYFNTPILFVVFFLLAFTSAKAEIRIDTVHCICGSTSLGGVTIIATGTAGPFTFQWSGPDGYASIEQSPEDLAIPGLYEVTVVNAYGCAVTLSAEVGACPVIDPLILTPTSSCIGASTGVITLTEITTGTAPYTYAWSTGDTTNFINNLAPGEYCLTVTDASGCTAQACATITSEQVLDIEAQITHVCGDQHNGGISLNVEGGTPPYAYHWNNGWPLSEMQPLSPGIYKVTVTDDEGCMANSGFEVIANAQPVIASVEITEATCADSGDGVICITAGGGTAPYAYAWNTGPLTNCIQNLDGATYCAVVTDANGCMVNGCYSTMPATSQDAAPYVKRVQLFAVPVSGGAETEIYDGEWVTTAAGCLFFTGGTLEISQPLMTAIAAGDRKLRIEAELSETMQTMSVGGNSFLLNSMTTTGADIWGTTFPENTFAAAVNNNTLLEEFTFLGTDLNGNSLFNLHSAIQNQTPCVNIPQLQPNCLWEPGLTSNSGQVHVLERKCLQIDFDLNMELGNIRALITGGAGPYTFSWQEEGHATVIGTEQVLSGLDPGRYCVSITDVVHKYLQETLPSLLPVQILWT